PHQGRVGQAHDGHRNRRRGLALPRRDVVDRPLRPRPDDPRHARDLPPERGEGLRRMAKTGADELVFLPLGGSNEIGMNFNLYGFGPPHDRRWIVVDLGVTFGDQLTPGVEVILPDPSFIEDYADRI